VGNCSIDQQEGNQCHGGGYRERNNKNMSLSSSSGFVGGRGASLEKSGINSATANLDSASSDESLCQNTPEKIGHVSDKLGTKCPILGPRLDNNIKNISKPATGVESKTCSVVEAAPGEGEDIFTDTDPSTEAPVSDLPEMPQDAAWIVAKTAICVSSPHLRSLFDQLAPRRLADGTLSLDGPSALIINIIERQYGRRIAEALRQAGVDRHQYGVWSSELRQQMDVATRAFMHQERAREVRQRQQAAAARAICLARLAPAEQFQQLESAYPAGKSSKSAFVVFLKMHKRGDIPALSTLLSALSRDKGKSYWQNNNGKYIPQLSNWLDKKQWEQK